MKAKYSTICVIFLAVVLACSIWACGGGVEDDDDDVDTTDDDDDSGPSGEWGRYRDALPDEDSLSLMLPEQDKAGSKGLGELATFYDSTVDFTREVNGHVLLFLGHIDEITSYSPTTQEGDTLTWGPWTDPYTPPTSAEMLFTMTEVTTDNFEYALQWRLRDSEDPWENVWTGTTTASTSTARRGVGEFLVDFTTARAIDPTVDESGLVMVDYDTITDGRRIDIEYDDFYSEDWEDGSGPPEAIDATYNYYNHADNTGTFLFDWWDDVHVGTTYDQYDAMEHLWFSTRWEAVGSGRSDVIVTDGDLPQIGIDFYGFSGDEWDASECWGEDFLRDYYIETFILVNGDEYNAEEGDDALCVFDADFPQI